MRKVTFKQGVNRPIGDAGIVAMRGGIQYAVKTAKDQQWYKESQLSAR